MSATVTTQIELTFSDLDVIHPPSLAAVYHSDEGAISRTSTTLVLNPIETSLLPSLQAFMSAWLVL